MRFETLMLLHLIAVHCEWCLSCNVRLQCRRQVCSVLHCCDFMRSLTQLRLHLQIGGLTRVLQVDDVLHTALTEQFDVLTDKGTLDAIGLSAGAVHDR